MPVFVEDPAQFSKERLKSELIANNVELPPAESNKRVYLDLYMKSVKSNTTDFSSDEEDDGHNGNEEKEEVSDMVDLHLLTDDQLKTRLIQYGVKPGPIVASTRALYEKKLHRLMEGLAQTSRHRVNGTAVTGQYSDSEEEDDKESESEQFRSEAVAQSESIKTASRIENRFSPQSKHTEIERRSSQKHKHTINSRTLQDFTRLNKDTMTGRSLCLMSPSSHQKQTVTEPVTDVLTEMFPDTAKTPTGIFATKRRPIKGAAGRPVQYKYPEMPLLSPTTLERQEIHQRLVPLWVQIVVFLLVACLLFIIYLSMDESLYNPFNSLLDGLQEIPTLISSSQDTPATDAAA